MKDKRNYNAPFPHQNMPAQLKNIDIEDVLKYRCGLCGRILQLRDHTDFLFCPFHGSLQLNQLVIPKNPRKHNAIDSKRIHDYTRSLRQLELEIYTTEYTHPIGE